MIFRPSIAVAAIALTWCGCSSSAPEVKNAPTPVAATEPPPDQSQHFPQTGLVKMDRIADHLLDKNFMPGGNLATYKRGKLEYQQFLGKMPDADHAAFLLLDWNRQLTGSKYLAHMGGYFGLDGARPVYVFTKGAWIAGIAGLPQEQADAIAREFAARL
jgi:hypothetical protein